MFESAGELVVVSILLGVTVFAFLYLARRGSHGKGTNPEPAENIKGDPRRNSTKSA